MTRDNVTRIAVLSRPLEWRKTKYVNKKWKQLNFFFFRRIHFEDCGGKTIVE